MNKVLEELAKLSTAKLTLLANSYDVAAAEQQIFLLAIIAELNRRNWFNKNLLMRTAPSVYSITLFTGCAKLGLKCNISNKIMEVVKNG